jgi:hypothetical protein
MAKVKVRSAAPESDAVEFDGMTDTPTQHTVKAAQSDTFTVTTKKGRTLTVKPLAGLKRLQFLKLLGSENAKNELYVSHCGLAVCVTAIDGEAVPFPSSLLQLEHLYQRLDDDGIEAVMRGFQTRLEGRASSEADLVAELKNS